MKTLRYFYHSDHLGSTSWVTDSAKNGVQYCEYLPYGEPFIDQRSTTWSSRYTFSGRERDSETGYSYFGARYYHSDLSIWLSVDPMSDKYPGWSSYNFCLNNPIRLFDPNGMTPWPLLLKFNGYGRSHANNWNQVRTKSDGTKRYHKGVDMNHTGGGNSDFGAPIVSTHDEYVERIVTDDKNAGGVRIVITSQDGTVSTSYMHLSGVSDLEVGSKVYEGQQIGQMGGSGFGKDDAYDAHLHYEVRLNGVNINPIGSDGNPIDPQLLLKPEEIFDKTNKSSESSGSPQSRDNQQLWKEKNPVVTGLDEN